MKVIITEGQRFNIPKETRFIEKADMIVLHTGDDNDPVKKLIVDNYERDITGHDIEIVTSTYIGFEPSEAYGESALIGEAGRYDDTYSSLENLITNIICDGNIDDAGYFNINIDDVNKETRVAYICREADIYNNFEAYIHRMWEYNRCFYLPPVEEMEPVDIKSSDNDEKPLYVRPATVFANEAEYFEKYREETLNRLKIDL